jgi:hypothetical protein
MIEFVIAAAFLFVIATFAYITIEALKFQP